MYCGINFNQIDPIKLMVIKQGAEYDCLCNCRYLDIVCWCLCRHHDPTMITILSDGALDQLDTGVIVVDIMTHQQSRVGGDHPPIVMPATCVFIFLIIHHTSTSVTFLMLKFMRSTFSQFESRIFSYLFKLWNSKT